MNPSPVLRINQNLREESLACMRDPLKEEVQKLIVMLDVYAARPIRTDDNLRTGSIVPFTWRNATVNFNRLSLRYLDYSGFASWWLAAGYGGTCQEENGDKEKDARLHGLVADYKRQLVRSRLLSRFGYSSSLCIDEYAIAAFALTPQHPPDRRREAIAFAQRERSLLVRMLLDPCVGLG